MEMKEILSKVDHTLLSQTATWEDVQKICDDGMKYKTASVCIPPSFVKKAKEYVDENIKVCTVIGFPNGYNTTAVKVFETIDAVTNGADEIDMVVNIGWIKEKRWDEIQTEIKKIRKACDGKILKVIIETCLLTDDEKAIMCGIVYEAGADYIKTSTGFSTGGATKKDVKLLAECRNPELRIKAAGGISSIQDAEDFINLGADRLGTSKIVKQVKWEEAKNKISNVTNSMFQ